MKKTCMAIIYWTTFILTIFSLQVTDYAIARRIVDLHSRLGEAVERTYSVVGVFFCPFGV